MMVGEHATIMFVNHATFGTYSKLPMGDPTKFALALYNNTVPARDDVDTIVDTALAEGAIDANDDDAHGFMYSRAFFDLDGHGWQFMWVDPAAAEQGQEEVTGVS